MTDLISRSAALTVGNVRQVVEYDEAGYDMTYDAVPVEAIEALPAIDAVPVVRCKDCEFRGDSFRCPLMIRVRDTINFRELDNALDDDFCSRGKRKDAKEDD